MCDIERYGGYNSLHLSGGIAPGTIIPGVFYRVYFTGYDISILRARPDRPLTLHSARLGRLKNLCPAIDAPPRQPFPAPMDWRDANSVLPQAST